MEAVEEIKKKNKGEDSEEKTKLRRFLREKDLKKHLKGKSSIEGIDENASEELKVKKLDEDLKKDNQLQQAVSLLSGWEVMKIMFKKIRINGPDSNSRISMK